MATRCRLPHPQLRSALTQARAVVLAERVKQVFAALLVTEILANASLDV
ncbi:MAG: hypothetical protein ACREV5_10325 [Steroidobacter sp.]